MRVAKGPDGLAISRVNFNFALAKAEKCRTQKSSTALHSEKESKTGLENHALFCWINCPL